MYQPSELPQSHKPSAQRLRCRYVNNTSKYHIVRVVNIPDYFFERAVYPDQQIVFEAFADAQLQVHTGACISAVLADTIPCCRLALEHVTPGAEQRILSTVVS